MEDYYKIIGTNKHAVDYDINGKKRTVEEKLEFIKEKYEYQIRIMENRKTIARNQNNQEKLEELNAQMEAISYGYQQIKSSILEQEYEQKSDKTQKQDSMTRIFKKKTPYELLNLLEESMKCRTDEQNNKLIENRKQQLLSSYKKRGEASNNFKEKLKLQTQMLEIENAYETIKTPDRRKEYAKQQEEKDEEEQNAKKIEEKYSHISECKAYLINDGKNVNDKSLQNKIVEKQVKLSEQCLFMDKNNRQLRIRQTGRINFENWTTVNKLFINEYEVKREINGEEKIDIVYINLDFRDLKKSLTVDEKTRTLINPDYYNCIANELLAEETIEGSKYNGGYMGGIEKDKNGKYHITLANKKLLPMEQEQMTAVIIMQQREKSRKEENVI